MALCAISLGGNIGDVPGTFAAAMRQLTEFSGISGLQISRLYRTQPMGALAGDVFLNAAAVFETTRVPPDVLALLQKIENHCGRVRTVRWGPRTLDLDLLLYGSDILQSPPMGSAGTLLRSVAKSPPLTVPHPAMWCRRFVLDPLVELIPDAVHPVFQLSIRHLRERLLARPLPVCFLVAQTFLSVRTDRKVCASEPTSAAIIFAGAEGSHPWPQAVRLPDDEPAARQLAADVLTAALDEPVVVS